MMTRIIYEQQGGVAAIVAPSPNWKGTIAELAAVSVPEGAAFDVVPVEQIPVDRTFRNAWQHDLAGKAIKTDIVKATDIAHDYRREKRAEELAPLDVEATIPSKASAAEAGRQVIRDKYAVMQLDIDVATTEAELKQVLINGGVL